MAKRKKQVWRAGIDVSAKTLDVAFEGEDDVLVFKNDPAGHKTLAKRLTKRGRHVRVVLESTGTYHFDLAVALACHERIEVMVVNPRRTKAFHAAQDLRAKTDQVDARSLLEFCIRMEFQPWSPPSSDVLAIRQVNAYRDGIVRDRTRIKNRLHAVGTSDKSHQFVVRALTEQLETLTANEKAADEELVRLIKSVEKASRALELLVSMPNIGQCTAAKLIADFLVLDPTMTAKEVTAWAGLDPAPRRSGTSVRGRSKISKRGSSRVRAALYMPAVTVLRNKGGPMKAFYERVLASSSKKKVALVAVMRKLLTIAWAIYRTGAPWDARKAMPKVSGESPTCEQAV